METKYNGYFLNMIIFGFISITVLNSAFRQIGYDLIKYVSDLLNINLNLCFDLEKSVYLLAGIFIILKILNRDSWLPFLGESVLPSTLVPIKKIEGDTIVKVLVKPNVKVAYWGAKPISTKNPDVKAAYDDYSNSGVVMSDENGIAILTLNKGSSYYVPSGKHINSHVHYRVLTDDYAMMGPIQTHYF
jgi:hypothetical protein